MPVFGIVPYRTEARTRSEARIQAAVDELLRILKTVNEVIRTAEGRLIELFRPPPVTLGTFIDPDLGISNMELRAYQKMFKSGPNVFGCLTVVVAQTPHLLIACTTAHNM